MAARNGTAPSLNLYLLERPGSTGYDEFGALVVCALTRNRAKMIHPRAATPELYPEFAVDVWDGTVDVFGTWVNADQVKVTYLGKAAKGLEPGVVLASFNAG